ncbi:MAG: hypothetical protein KI790_07840 [Cyclobacteriaceae bacterium]|nr:hypothetical protein [Cyclobacteriaceae bacterium HetDA_MAG_MS6]
MNQTIGTIEMVLLKAKTGYSEKQALDALTSLNNCMQQYSGFAQRKLARDENGLWMDLVYWTNKSSALHAAESIMQDSQALKAFEVIEQQGMKMYHFNPEVIFPS